MKMRFLLLFVLLSFHALGADDSGEKIFRLASVEYLESDALIEIDKIKNIQEYLLDVDDKGRTPFHVAINAGKLAVSKKLIDTDKLVLEKVDAQSLSPLHTAVQNMSEVAVAKLIKWGADPSSRDKDGKTAMRILLEDVPNFRSDDQCVNYWTIGKAILTLLGAAMSYDDLLDEKESLSGLKRNKYTKSKISYFVVTPLNEAIREAQKRLGSSPKKRKAEREAFHEGETINKKRKQTHIYEQILTANGSCSSCGVKLQKGKIRSLKVDDMPIYYCNACGLRAKLKGFCPKCYGAFYHHDNSICRRSTCERYLLEEK